MSYFMEMLKYIMGTLSLYFSREFYLEIKIDWSILIKDLLGGEPQTPKTEG